MALSVIQESVGKKLNRLLIYSNGCYIGEYERSHDAHVERKKAEISAAESTLLSIFEKHGEFRVRWNGQTHQKSIRANDIEVGVIPKNAWRAP